MKKSILHVILLLVPALSFAQINYDNGIFDGKYQSTYPNGNKKATGKFKNNQRVGDWEFYDESGEFAAKITYVCNTEFKTQATDNTSEVSLTVPLNDFDKLFLLPLDERDVIWTKRLYRDILASEFNLPSNFNFFNYLNTIQSDKPLCFNNGEFQIPFKSLNEIPHSKEPIIGYRIKLDYFFRKDFNFMDCRIVGIAPLYITNEGKTGEICWLYYHGLKDLVFEKIVNNDGRSMETILQTRSYHSTIYKELNVSGKTVEETTPDENERKALYQEIDQSIIEAENDFIIKSYF